jgi:hypothetical protein
MGEMWAAREGRRLHLLKSGKSTVPAGEAVAKGCWLLEREEHGTCSITGDMLRTSVSTSKGDWVKDHTTNSVLYPSSLIPGQCAPVAHPAPPVISMSMCGLKSIQQSI